MKVLWIIVIALLAVTGLVIVRQLPEIRRYKKISSL
jgi:cytochrome b subunit of formate dehydrogenase